jgi:hypothetical protein
MTIRERAEKLLSELPDEQVPAAVEALEGIERDARVLRVLRERDPRRSEQELMESLKRIREGDVAIGQIRERFAGVPSGEIEREAARAVREVRRERASPRRSAG